MSLMRSKRKKGKRTRAEELDKAVESYITTHGLAEDRSGQHHRRKSDVEDFGSRAVRGDCDFSGDPGPGQQRLGRAVRRRYGCGSDLLAPRAALLCATAGVLPADHLLLPGAGV